MTIIEILEERRDNCLALAKTKPLKDRAGWQEDAHEYQLILAAHCKLLAACKAMMRQGHTPATLEAAFHRMNAAIAFAERKQP